MNRIYRGARVFQLRGRRGDPAITVEENGQVSDFFPRISARLLAEGREGFDWGLLGGIGAFRLAFTLLHDATDGHLGFTEKNCELFTHLMISFWGDSWQITQLEILEWLRSMNPKSCIIPAEIGGMK